MTTDIAPNTGLEKFKESAKAYAGLVGTLVTALIAVGVNEPYGYALALIGAVATAVGVWAASNAESATDREERELLEKAASGVLPEDPYPAGYAETVADEDVPLEDADEPEHVFEVAPGGEVEQIDARDLR